MYTHEDLYEKPEPKLLPGQEICDCGRIREVEDRHRCVHCGAIGCIECFRIVDDTGYESANDNWVCGSECAIAWLEELQAKNERDYRSYEDWVGKRIEEERVRQVTEEITSRGWADI